MAQANISISIDEGLKEQAESLFSKLDMNMSMAISLFLRQMVKQGKIPVEVSEENDPLQGFVIPEGEENDPFWSPANIRHLKKAIADIEAGKYVVHDMQREFSEEEFDDDTPLLTSDEICPYCHQRHVYRGREMREALEEAERISHDPNIKGHTFEEFLAAMREDDEDSE